VTKVEVTEKAAGAVAVACATGAVTCAVGCVLPFALPAVALASIGSILSLLAGAYVWMTDLAVVAVACAWAWICLQSVRSSARPARSTLYMMGAATSLSALALLWPWIEPEVLQMLGSP
jgi:hypothetical protein